MALVHGIQGVRHCAEGCMGMVIAVLQTIPLGHKAATRMHAFYPYGALQLVTFQFPNCCGTYMVQHRIKEKMAKTNQMTSKM